MRKFAVLLLLALSGPASAGATAWIPFEVNSGHIYLEVTLNGKPATALLDSGAEGNAISEAFIQEHELDYTRGREIIVSGVNSEVTTNYVDDVILGIYNTEIEVDHLMPFGDAGFDFIIGLPFFQEFIVQIDYPGSQLRFITHDAVDMKKFANVKMKRASNTLWPIVRVELNGEYSPWLIFDTGSSGGVFVQRSRAEKYGWLEKYATEAADVTGFTGRAADVEVFRLPSLTIGPFTLENVKVTIPAEGGHINLQQWRPGESNTYSKINRSETADGILGYDVLKHFIVTVDFKRMKLNLDVPR